MSKIKLYCLLICLFFSFLLASCGQVISSNILSEKEFVRVEGNNFMIGDTSYYYAGVNFWFGCYLGATQEGRERLVKELDFLKEIGITNLRVLGASEESTRSRSVTPAIQTEPGVYDESLLVGLDYLLDEMGKRDMKAVVFLNNYWEWSGGMGQYMGWVTNEQVEDPYRGGSWTGLMAQSARFYSNEKAQEIFRDYIEMLINRKNTVNGLEYKSDPTIMTWELANEPRPGPNGRQGERNLDSFYKWIQETAAYIKSLDSNHLITPGTEGTWGCLEKDEVFMKAHSFDEIDYGTVHLWPKNWSWFIANQIDQTLPKSLSNAKQYLDNHIKLGKELGKPLILEEFGLDRDNGELAFGTPVTARDQFLKLMYDMVYEDAKAGGSMAGTNVWSWGGFGRGQNADGYWKPGDPYTGDPPQEKQGLNCIYDTDESTIAILKEHSQKMQSLIP